MLKMCKRTACIGCRSLNSRTGLLLQIASCSVHHSGALLLEVRDGEFLDAHLCSTSVASSNHLQQPDPDSEAAFQASGAPQEGTDFMNEGPEGFGNEYDNCDGDGGDGGDDYMHQEAVDQHDDGMPGGHLSMVIDNAALQYMCCQLNHRTLHFQG